MFHQIPTAGPLGLSRDSAPERVCRVPGAGFAGESPVVHEGQESDLLWGSRPGPCTLLVGGGQN